MATEVRLPDIGEGIEKGTVVGVLVKVGDTVAKDQPLVELETDKAVVEIPSSASGVVSKINVAENQEAAVGSVLIVVEEEGVAAAPAAAQADAQPAKPAQPATPSAQAAPTAATPAQRPPAAAVPTPAPAAPQPAAAAAGTDAYGGLVPAAPSVRRLARELGVDLQSVTGSGALGRISAADVRAFAGAAPAPAPGRELVPVAPGSAPAAPAAPLPDFSRWGEVTRTPMSGIRKATVRSMSNAWSTVPMVTHFDKADITELEVIRKRYQPKVEAAGAKLTPTAILLKVVAGALRRFPDFNASIDVAGQEVVHKQYVNVGVAVDTDAGLLVPVIKNADRKNLIELSVELGELAVKARDRKLTPDEMQGGNFSISNLGGIGGHAFTPIVNPPDVAILGVSRASFEPVWNRATETFEPRFMMPLALTYDHRLIDGAAAARFLRWVCGALEEPFLVALEG